MVDNNQMRRGAKVAAFGSFNLKPDRCVALHQIDNYLDLTEDQEPCPQQSPSWEGMYKPIPSSHQVGKVCIN